METKVLFQSKGELHMLSSYPIQPRHINTEKLFFDSFGNTEKEASAVLIVKFCQKAGGWVSFTLKEIMLFYRGDFRFNGLDHTDPRLAFIFQRDDRYIVTHDFIVRCFQASPAIGQF